MKWLDPVYSDRVSADRVYGDPVIPRVVAESRKSHASNPCFLWILQLACRMTILFKKVAQKRVAQKGSPRKRRL